VELPRCKHRNRF